MKKKRTSQPVSVLDIAAYILANHSNNRPIEAWKMHKLAYYCQAWCLVREEVPFFVEKIMATPKSVMIHELYPQHYQQLYIGGSTIGNLNHLSLKQVDTLDFVMKKYGNKTVDELDELIRSEVPWKEASQKIHAKSKEVEISLDSMLAFYSKQDT
jgi:uncharacterized phage-associated protein